MTIVSYCPAHRVGRFACAQAGCRDCMESLLRENSALVWLVVTRQACGQATYADLLQEGRIGLWCAIRHFDEDRGVCFSTYACVVIRHQVWQAVRRSLKAQGWQAQTGQEASLDQVVRHWQQAQVHEVLGEALGVLPKRLRAVIEMHYGLGGQAPQNLAEIGREWGLSRERIRQLHNEALALLRLPALSIRLRGLCERQERSHYRQALGQNRSWQRQVRGRR